MHVGRGKGVWAESGTWVTFAPTLAGTKALPPECNYVDSALYSFSEPHQNMAHGFKIVLWRNVSGLLNLVYILVLLIVKSFIIYVYIVLKA